MSLSSGIICNYKTSPQGLLIVALTIIFLAWVIQSILIWRRKRNRMINLVAKLPGPKPLPLFGNALLFVCKPEELFDRTVQTIVPYDGPTPMQAWLGPLLYVVITEPRDIEIVLHSQSATCKGWIYKLMVPFIGDGLITGSGPAWRAHRKLIAPILKGCTLKGYVDIVQRHTNILISKLKPLANGAEFDIGPYLTRCTVDAMCEAIMGYRDMNTQEDSEKDKFAHSTEKMYEIVHARMMKIWLQPDSLYRLTSKYKEQRECQRVYQSVIEEIIATKREDLSGLSNGRNNVYNEDQNSVLIQLLKHGKQILNDQELRDEIFTMFLASQDTMAVMCSFAMLMLGIHKDVQVNVRNEVMGVFRDQDVVAESLCDLTYLEMVVKETMRLFPIAPFMVRTLKSDLTLGTCVLPEGCEVVLASFVTQRSSRHWKNPEEFNPERFTAEEAARRHPYAFVPFSGGLMGCIGQKFAMMSMKTMIANLVKSYAIDCTKRIEDIKLKSDISVRCASGYELSMKSL